MVRTVYDIDDMLRKFRARGCSERGSLVALSGLSDRDGYNPSGPVPNGDRPVVYVRVERRDVDADSWIVPFRHVAVDSWELDHTLPAHQLEDPQVTTIHGSIVISGVRITARTAHGIEWETVFLRGTSPTALTEFAVSPKLMKDVRLIELRDGRIGVFTRPWGQPRCRAWIGYTEIEHLDDLTTAVMENAPLIGTQPVPGQWWGANALYELETGHIGVLAHIAKWDGDSRSYYPIVFQFDRQQRSIVTGPRIIAERACFPYHPPKRADLRNVIFPSWIDRGSGLLYGGLSDSTIGVLAVGDPFAADD